MSMSNISFTQAIHDATFHALTSDPTVMVLGLGVSYKNGADGTMGDFGKQFPDRVLDTPVSEAAVTGMAVGAAITGMRPIVHHGRVEFALFAIDQIVNQAAKWNYQFGGDNPVPIVFRIAVGRQWGNGPQHTQALYSLFAGVPGLKVVVPSSPRQAKGLLTAAIKDNNPVVFLEPRWLYKTTEDVEDSEISLQLNLARVVRRGTSVTIVCYGDGVIEAMKAIPHLLSVGVDPEIIDLVSINPIDFDAVSKSTEKTNGLVVVDMCPFGAGVGASIAIGAHTNFINGVSCDSTPCPTAPSMSEAYYPTYHDIVVSAIDIVNSRTFGYRRTDVPNLPTISFDEHNLAPQFQF